MVDLRSNSSYLVHRSASRRFGGADPRPLILIAVGVVVAVVLLALLFLYLAGFFSGYFPH